MTALTAERVLVDDLVAKTLLHPPQIVGFVGGDEHAPGVDRAIAHEVFDIAKYLFQVHPALFHKLVCTSQMHSHYEAVAQVLLPKRIEAFLNLWSNAYVTADEVGSDVSLQEDARGQVEREDEQRLAGLNRKAHRVH